MIFTRLLATAFVLATCDPYPAFTREDGGRGAYDSPPPTHGDSGPLPAAPRCGEETRVIVGTTRDIHVDTRVAPGETFCGATHGPAVYVAIDAVAGDYYHTHLSSVDPEARPGLALTLSCDFRSCMAESNHCSDSGDEHFGFVAEASGRYWLAIYDEAPAGGTYILEVYRPVCGDGTREHGEACDDGNALDGDGCDRRCRAELSAARAHELEPNENRFEANALRLDGGALTVTGSLGGPGACAYPDVFALAHPGGAVRVAVGPHAACGDPSGASARVRLTNAAGVVVAEADGDVGACIDVELSAVPAGELFVELSSGETAIPIEYALRVEIP